MSSPLPLSWFDQAPQPIQFQAGCMAIPTSTNESATDRSDLSQHLLQCAHACGRMHRLQCAAEAFDHFLAPRFVTTLGVMTLLILAGMTLLS